MDEDYNYTRSPAWEELVNHLFNTLQAGLKNEQGEKLCSEQTGFGLLTLAYIGSCVLVAVIAGL